ncbi:hypothetical protein HCTV-16_gp42 [Haloarcula virus HCTV-16]|nr:hypothetical protein HCTV-16_gp42 [Haloarcula virus HCTV-16]
MADTVVSDAVRFPQDEGVGSISEGSETWNSAGYLGGIAEALGDSSFVHNGLTFSNHDATADTISVEPGRAYVKFSSVDVQSQLGGDVPAHDTTMPSSVFFMLVLPTSVASLPLQDSATSSVWVAYATDGGVSGVSAGDIYIRTDDTGSVSAPSHPSVKLGEANPDDSSADTRASDGATVDLSSLTADDLTATDLTATNLTVQDILSDVDFQNHNVTGINELEVGSFDNDDYHTALRVYRNGNLIGWLDQSGDDVRLKGFGTADAEIVNDNSEGMAIRSGTANADFDADLEINNDQALVNDQGESVVYFNEVNSLTDGVAERPVPRFGTLYGTLHIFNQDDGEVFKGFVADTSVTLEQDPASTFSTIQGNTGTTNVYHDGSDIVVENQTGAENFYDVVFVGMTPGL